MKIEPALTPSLTTWLLRQPLFFVASAPRHGAHVNLSPKGLPGSTLSVLSPTRLAFIDRGGSGCETISHVYENGRVTVMFCSFGPNPRIMRLFCTGRVVEWADPAFAYWLRCMGQPRPEGLRAILILDIFEVQTSCGYGVPRLRRQASVPRPGAETDENEDDDDEPGHVDIEKQDGPQTATKLQFLKELAVFEDRETLGHWLAAREKKGGILPYQVQNNTRSLDGLPGLRVARREAGERLWLAELQARLRRILAEKDGIMAGFVLAVFGYLLLRLGAHSGLFLASSSSSSSTTCSPPSSFF
jgi:hypothetical protein